MFFIKVFNESFLIKICIQFLATSCCIQVCVCVTMSQMPVNVKRWGRCCLAELVLATISQSQCVCVCVGAHACVLVNRVYAEVKGELT